MGNTWDKCNTSLSWIHCTQFPMKLASQFYQPAKGSYWVSQVIHSICVSWVWRAYISCRQKGTLRTRCDNSLFLHLHTLFPSFCPSFISLVVPVDIKHHVYFQGVIHIAPSITRISPGWNPAVSQQPLDLCVSHKGLVVLSFMCKLSDSLRNCSDFYWVQ